MSMRKFRGAYVLSFFGCMAVMAVVVQETVSAWNVNQQVPYFGYYFIENGDLGVNHVNELSGYANLAVIRPDNTAYTPSIGAQYDNAGMYVIVELGISEERLNNPFGSDFQGYLADIYAELSSANLWDNVIAFAPAEEWHDRVIGGDVGQWSTFSGITPLTHGDDCGAGSSGSSCWITARRDLLVSKLNDVIAAIETDFPDKSSLLVDPMWSDGYDLGGTMGAVSYRPVPSNLDILGIDAYIGFKHTENHTSDCGPAMRQMFIDDVKWKFDHALTYYPQPILIVGQAFDSLDWPMTSPCQMNWWYSLAQSDSRFLGLVWFAYGLYGSSSDQAVGVRSYSDLASWLRNMYLHNQCIPGEGGCPDIMSPGRILFPDNLRTSIDGRFQLYYQLDGNLVLYGPSGPLWASDTVGTSPGQAIMQGDGNFVIYDSSGTPIWSTGTVGNPGAWLTVQPDGNVVIYTPGAPNESIWATNTCCH